MLAAIAAAALSPGRAAAGPAPRRVVSLNLCTDQLVLALAHPGTIAAITHLARDPRLSAYTEAAGKVPTITASTEEVLGLDPDLVVAGRYNNQATLATLERLGHKVLALDLPKSFAELGAQLRALGRALGNEARASAVIDGIDARLARIPAPAMAQRPEAAVYQANGFTMGRGTLVNEVLNRAGLANLAVRLGLRGYGHLPLERLIRERPRVLVLDAGGENGPALAQAILEHPALRALAGYARPIEVPARYWVCATPATVAAVELISAERQRLETKRAAP